MGENEHGAMRRTLDIPNKLDSNILYVEVARLSNSGTPIAYPVDEEKQGLFIGYDGIHLDEGEPGEVLKVEITAFSKMRAEAKLTWAEKRRRNGETSPTNQSKMELSEEEIQRREAKANKSHRDNQEFRESLSQSISDPELEQEEDNCQREVEADDDNDPFNDDITGSKNNLL